ncbi:hypothetical protein FBF31_01705 [Candidatus Saccharibacteria bacterium oral taxon 955]|jgi:hypothetical protein|nr:hypothetical protein FBF33_01700 [Candidatus Saccharibacteria bacterium oral taxon 955]QHU91224.1 hypothetical protein GWK75_02005 [Candidatus Saccharibacteria bacterium oral taxon 955]QJU05790.1 hypothetical protein FBF31_01705 [Candidatus Saccharibacteria bacterium oral taxon 955]QJU06616.1 hypothetical protein FBF30_01765 [Candidatus Saccharibacteria bacterium oral taxon 955]
MVKKAASSAKVNRTSAKKPATRKRRVSKSTKVDYYPNRMTVAVSALAGTVLVLFALISVYGAYHGWQ